MSVVRRGVWRSATSGLRAIWIAGGLDCGREAAKDPPPSKAAAAGGLLADAG